MVGGGGVDTFVIRAGDGSATLENADIVYDFVDGTDVIGLDGLTFNDLTISQGTGDYEKDTVVTASPRLECCPLNMTLSLPGLRLPGN